MSGQIEAVVFDIGNVLVRCYGRVSAKSSVGGD